MNLSRLFETQAALDARIFESHPELKGQDNLDWKVLALQVELGECANEWRGFKKWSKNQEARNYDIPCHACKGIGYFVDFNQNEECMYCNGTGVQEKNPLLVEYVDCLHFILSIGIELDIEEELEWDELTSDVEDVIEQFSLVFKKVADLSGRLNLPNWLWRDVFEEFYLLGTLLGFTWEQIEQAYYAKNQVNHQRQESGY